MSWDQQAYSFGNPNAQPPTPTQTPTSGQFPSPLFQTPRNNNSSFEDRTGWTPTFAEEYSVFNATPGRLTNSQHSFAEASTPRPSTTSTQIRHHSTPGDIAAELASHVHHFSPNPSLPLPPVDPSNQLPSSPGPYSATQNRFDETSKQTVTPRKPRKRLEEAFSGQTATPPPTASKGSRKLAPKLSRETMQNDSQDGHFGSSQTPTQQSAFMSFTESGDFFNYPMSAPATAPTFANTKPFWDPDASMSGMDMDFTTDVGIFSTSPHKVNNSYDWGRNNQMFQETVNLPPPQTQTTQPPVSKRPRPLAPKLPITSAEIPTSIPPFNFNPTSAAEDPFAMPETAGGVDPGLLFSRPSSQSTSSGFGDVPLPPTRPVTSHTQLRPYQHQLRESRRDQEELRRSRSSRENSRSHRSDRGTVSSPIRGSARPGLQRSVSDDRGRRTQDRVMLSRSGRISPVKQRPSVLTSIPELQPPKTRTEVKFTIDANGRARTETVLVEEPRVRRRIRSRHGYELESSSYESSSDDEPILVPSRNSSFTLPNQPKLSRFETSGHGLDDRRHSNGYSQSESSSQRSYRHHSLESEAETVLEEDDGSGDATRELRKVMENRKKIQMKPRDPYYNRQSGPTPRGNHYTNYLSSNISPTTITDPDGLTPSASSSRSGTTRCVCSNPESEGFMIQCESCDNWLHAECVNIDRRSLPPVYICAFCANTPNMRGGRIREPARKPLPIGSSPLAHKSLKSFR